mgnify:FL=1
MKTYHKCLVAKDEDAAKLCDQLTHVRDLTNPFILHTRDIFQGRRHRIVCKIDEKNVYVLTDFCSGGNLFTMLQTFGHLNESHVKFIVPQLVTALSYLHENRCIHGNLICENVLLDEQGNTVLTGFSNSIFNYPTPCYETIGFTECLAPETLLNKGIDKMYDFWMLGCLVYGSFPIGSIS